MKDSNLNDFKKAKTPDIEFVKFQGRLDSDLKRIHKQQSRHGVEQ